jgi:exodeoxyribonuclease VII large subunit
MADPYRMVTDRRTAVEALRDRAFRCAAAQLDRAGEDLVHTRARVLALSPQATLDRGYAVVERGSDVVRDADQISAGELLSIRLAKGVLAAKAE